MADSSIWLALMIGNSRLHWAWFVREKLKAAWDTEHLPATVVQQLANCRTLADFPAEISLPHQLNQKSKTRPEDFSVREAFSTGVAARSPVRGRQNPKSLPPLYLASVVPHQTALWQAYPDVHLITLDQIPLQGIYPTLGIDRALALWGAGEAYGFPILVIDAGTALTFTAADVNCFLVGGAILPGLGLQLQSLSQRTANLPLVEIKNGLSLPQRWALNTPKSIQSGAIYTITAGIRDFIQAWWQEFPASGVVMTGGDGNLLLTYLRSRFPEIASKVVFEPHLIFWGMRSLKSEG